MARFIDAASLIKYNANNRGNNVGDCVCRSISFAFDISYSKASRLLNAKMKELHQSKWNISPVFSAVISELGGSNRIQIGSPGHYKTVNDFADFNPHGCYLVLCGENPDNNRTNHILCIIDNKVYDSWDSLNQYAKAYYTCNNTRHVAETNLEESLDFLLSFGEQTLDVELRSLGYKWMDKLSKGATEVKWDLYCEDSYRQDYALKYTYRFKYSLSDTIYEDTGSIKFNIVCTLKPGMEEDDARYQMVKILKQRAYDRMYAVKESVKKDMEAFDASHAEGAELANSERLFFSAREKKFLNQLPGKVRPFISEIYIYDPGKHPNSYTITMNKLPNDSNSKKEITFESYESKGAREMIERYAETLERPWEDYDPVEEGYT